MFNYHLLHFCKNSRNLGPLHYYQTVENVVFLDYHALDGELVERIAHICSKYSEVIRVVSILTCIRYNYNVIKWNSRFRFSLICTNKRLMKIIGRSKHKQFLWHLSSISRTVCVEFSRHSTSWTWCLNDFTHFTILK